MAIVRTESLTKVYGDHGHPVQAVNGVSLAVEEGEFLAIMGPSGSGKSTLMYMIGGLEKPTSGNVWVRDSDLSKLNDDALSHLRRTQLGFVFQFYNLIPVLRARDNVAMPLILDGVKHDEALKRADAALAKVGLQDRVEHRHSELSGGQQQRVAIARALVTNPAMILADEPTGALDTVSSGEVLELFSRLNQQGRTIILITHEQSVAAHAQRVIRISDGTIIADERGELAEALG